MKIKINKQSLLMLLGIITVYGSFFATLGLNENTLNEINFDIIKIFNALRFSIPFILSIIMIVISLIIFRSNNIITNLLYLFFLFMIIPFFLYDRNITFMELYFFILSMGCISYFNILLYLKKYHLIQKTLILSILISSLSAFFLIMLKIEDINLFSANYYNLSKFEDSFLGYYFPRITGISRSIAILSLMCLFFFLKNNKKLYLIITILLNFFIWKFQSRGTIIAYGFSALFIITFFNDFKIKFIFKNIFLFFFLPVLLSMFVISPQNESIFDDMKKKITSSNQIKEKENDKTQIIQGKTKIIQDKTKIIQEEIRLLKKFPVIQDKTGSGRVVLWEEGLKNFKYKMGHGIQADRHLLTENPKFGTNISNAYLYSLLSGGYGSLIILVLLICIFTFQIINIFLLKKKKLKKINKYKTLSYTIISFFLLRSMIENSFTVFGTDLLITLPCIYCLLYWKNENIYNHTNAKL